jgi:hypothetical protein
MTHVRIYILFVKFKILVYEFKFLKLKFMES